MKIYIYNNLIDNPAVVKHNNDLVKSLGIEDDLNYLLDFYQAFQVIETKNPDEADYFFIPIFLTGWQLANHDPIDLINTFCPYIDRGNHIFVATGNYGQRNSTLVETKIPNRPFPKKYSWLDSKFILITLESTRQLITARYFIFALQSQSKN